MVNAAELPVIGPFRLLSLVTTMNTRCFQRHLSFPSHPARPVPLPSPMEAHLWCVVPQEVKSLSLLNEYMKILSPCERENVLSFRGEELQKRALLARALETPKDFPLVNRIARKPRGPFKLAFADRLTTTKQLVTQQI
ncbi:hypothetical protein AKJ16_DCAP05636 [Drosera capensis]